ncbi:MAG TPA: alpha/beta hydrolase [Polyangiaceae bacterium LLY-WYZ-15_(1-7)]|nr:hydrolase [Myxococcales bacterium]MAT27377.1 hydrolase [Sandaracinus sp.]HJL04825.1 alpha/beta hydrolase [Polyangiaceae bacterium LLY-WYZ-15_(1-7)]MBJ72487.1 hydrolase [Sandaracinus sp.]HJL09932.1 alpha/beta hydrolase [Polyangiaceae bacterium LLY-WYZ-15_(1-7)]
MSVRERVVRANGLAHHVLSWEAEGPTVLLAHGFLDLGWSWRWVAERLQAAGYRCVAWDWRGHGETEHVGAGGYYHFPDYVLDLDELLPQLRLMDEPVHLIGHSMGGTVSTMFAGLRSDRLASLTLVEGLGPPAWELEKAPTKFEAWLSSVAKVRGRRRPPRPLSLDECLRRMRMQNPQLDEEKGRFLAEKATRPAEGEEGEGRLWRFDRLHRTTSPMPFRVEIFGAFLERIAVPTLVVLGEKGFRLPDEAERYGRLADHEVVEIAGAGHMLHWEKPDELADAWLAFAP